MESIISRIRSHFLHNPIHTTTTTNCDIWEETLVRENGAVYFSDIDYGGQNPAIWDALDHLRRNARQALLSPEELALHRAEAYDLERAYLTEERKVVLHRALDKIHPEYKQTTIKCACGEVIETGSTKENITVEICSKCHPFFTGKQKLVDTGGRVEKFRKKFGLKGE